MENSLKWPDGVWSRPEVQADPAMDAGSVKGIFYTGLEDRKRPTKVFAYLGYPEGAASDRKVPAVVLLHGGGGTAFSDWVKVWNDRGYAAIAMDLVGNRPVSPGARTSVRHPDGGAPQAGFFDDIGESAPDQWAYQALGSAMLAHSLLREDPLVDASCIGLTGISWGGILSSILIGIDHRFAFAVPVYGSGYMAGRKSCLSQEFDRKPAAMQWEPSQWIPRAELPILWLSGDADPFFCAVSTSDSFAHSGNANLSLVHGYAHGHDEGWSREEVYAFADSQAGRGAPLTRLIPAEGDGCWTDIRVAVPDGVSLREVDLYYSVQGITYTEDGTSCITEWVRQPLEPELDRVRFEIPAAASVYYTAITDSRGLIVSSPCIEVG